MRKSQKLCAALMHGRNLMASKKPPLTPAEVLRIELEKRSLSQRSLAKILGGSWTAPKVSDIVSGKRGFSIETALDLETALGIPAEKWLKYQTERKLWEERRRRKYASSE